VQGEGRLDESLPRVLEARGPPPQLVFPGHVDNCCTTLCSHYIF
jgi:hypothetical protein